MYIRDRKEREEYMDDLERQMGDQREQIQRTLDGMEGSSQRGGMLSRLRGSLPRFPRRERGRGYLEEASEETAEDPESSGFTPSPPDPGGGPEMAAERPEGRSWWRRVFGT